MNFDQNIAMLMVIAVMNAITAALGFMTHRAITTTQADVLRIEKATNSMQSTLLANERLRGDATATALLEKIPSQVSQPAILSTRPSGQPLPVEDDRTATATERTASASERVASAAERSADIVESEAPSKGRKT